MGNEEYRGSEFILELMPEQEIDLVEQQETRFNLVLATPIAIHDYEVLINKPQINSVTLSGNLSLADLGIFPTEPLTIEDLDEILV